MENHPSMGLYAKRMTMVIGIMVVVISAGGMAFYRSEEALIFTLGVCITAAANMVKVYWLKRTMERALTLDPAFAPNFMRGQGLLRQLFVVAVLVGTGLLSNIEALGLPILFGALFGMMTMPVAAYSMVLFTRKDNQSDEPKGENGNV